MHNTEIAKLSWEKFGQIILQMAKEIQTDFKFTVIVGIGKSGNIPASILAKRLKINAFYSIIVSLYNEEKPPRQIYQQPQILFSSIEALKGKNVLIVDDFVNTGATLKMVLQQVANVGAKEVRSAVVGLRLDASYKPEYFGMTFKGCLWFPWDIPPHTSRSRGL
ncbi:MAG: phosphoribosyltransferase [Candidatus Hermodarchaeia archaeon]|jgi:hypoxanthine phosphoribosyltransferase